MSSLSIAARLWLLVLFLLVGLPAQWLALKTGSRIANILPMQFHRLFLKMFGVRVVERGGPPPAQNASLVVSNHVSWLDIPVVGSLHPLSFIAKSEVGTWPIIGTLARLQNCLFIDRERRKATAEINHAVAHRLIRGDVIVLFAEGTTNDGNRLLPFKSSLIGAAKAAVVHEPAQQVFLQPLAISYRYRNGLPVTRRERPGLAWYGDMALLPHLLHFLRSGPVDVFVTWGELINFDGDRKRASLQAEAMVRQALRSP